MICLPNTVHSQFIPHLHKVMNLSFQELAVKVVRISQQSHRRPNSHISEHIYCDLKDVVRDLQWNTWVNHNRTEQHGLRLYRISRVLGFSGRHFLVLFLLFTHWCLYTARCFHWQDYTSLCFCSVYWNSAQGSVQIKSDLVWIYDQSFKSKITFVGSSWLRPEHILMQTS